MEEKSCKRNHGEHVEAEATRRHPEGVQDASRRHPGSTQEVPRTSQGGPKEVPRNLGSSQGLEEALNQNVLKP